MIQFDLGYWIRAIQLIGCLLPCIAVAQTDTLTSKIHQLDNVEVSAVRRTPTLLATHPTQALGRKELNALGLQNMADAVRRFAGTNVRDYGGIGGLKTVSVRNLGAAHTAVSYDGVAVSNCQAGQIDIGRFSLDNVERIALSVGQSDELLQSARHFTSAGVLNIETERPHFDFDHHFQGKAQVRVGSFGLVSPSLRGWLKLSPRTTLSAEGSCQRADGRYPYLLENGALTEKQKRINSDIATYQAEANLYSTLNDSSRISVKAYYFYSDRGLPGSVILYNNTANERLWDENFFAQTAWQKTLSPQWKLQVQGKFNHSWNRYEDTNVKYAEGKQTDIYRQNEWYGNVTLQLFSSPYLTFSLAQDGAVNTLRSNLPEFAYPTRYTALTALNARYKRGILTATATLANTFISESLEVGSAPANREHLSPTVALTLQPWANQPLFVRLMYKNTFRAPTFNDLYYLRIGNKGLRPEKAAEYNVGITWSGKPADWLDYVGISLDGYYNEVTDKIVAFPSTYIWKMANYGKVHITGIDATFTSQWVLSPRYSVRLQGSYTYQRALDVTDATAKNYRNQLPYTPRNSGSMSVLFHTPFVNLGYTLTGVSSRYCLSENIPENKISGYAEQTLTLSRDFRLSGCKLHVSGELINLTDKQYQIIKYYPMPGRNARLTVNVEF